MIILLLFKKTITFPLGFSGGSVVKNPVNAGDKGWEIDPLGWEDPLEEEMATQSSILTWRISWTVKPGRLHSTGLQTSWT